MMCGSLRRGVSTFTLRLRDRELFVVPEYLNEEVIPRTKLAGIQHII
jgi:hypothetical protein